jgi:hypothetical protein
MPRIPAQGLIRESSHDRSHHHRADADPCLGRLQPPAARAHRRRLYLDDQLSVRVEALEGHKSYAADGDNAPLRVQAAKIAPVVQQHLDAPTRVKQA